MNMCIYYIMPVNTHSHIHTYTHAHTYFIEKRPKQKLKSVLLISTRANFNIN